MAGITLTQPYLLRLGIDSLQAGKFEPVYAFLIIGIGISQLGLGFLQRWAIQRTGHQIEADIRSDLFAKTQTLDRTFFDETSVGDLIVHSTSDISVQRNFITQGFINGFNTLVLGTLALGLMFAQNWRLAIIGLIFLPFLVVAFSWISRRMQKHYQSAQEQLGEVSNRAQEVFTGVRVVKAYTREEAETERYAAENEQYVNDSLKFSRLNSLLFPLIGLVMGLTTALLLWIGGNEIVAGRLTIGQFVQFNAYLLMLAGPLSNVGQVIALGQQAATSMGRLQQIFRLEPLIRDPEESEKKTLDPTRPRRGRLEFKNAGLRFGDRWVLRDINFKVDSGQTVAVVGPTGAGKSSLSALIGRVYDPDEGSVSLDGFDVRMLPLDMLRREVAYVPQETLLFSLSLRENIALGKSEAEDQEVLTAARLSRLAQDLPQIPGGFDALVGERGVTLSGGQKQRTAIARALLPEASLLILDDALSSVDARTQNLIAANLKMLTSQGRTTLIVTQRLSLVKDSDWIVVLDQGRVVDQGRHAELMARDGLYARMYRREQAAGQNIIDEDALAAEFANSTDNGDETSIPAIPGKSAKDRDKKGKQDEGDEIVIEDYQGKRLMRLLGYVWRYRKIVLIAAPVVTIAALLELAGPLLSKIAIDDHITKGNLNGLSVILWFYIATTLGAFVCRYLRSYFMQQIGQYVVRDLRVELFGKLLHNSLAFFDRYPSGSLIGRLTSDMDAINDLLSQGAVAVVADMISIVAILTTMLILDWRLTLVSLAVLPVLFIVSFMFRKVMRRAWRSSRRKYSILVGYLAENYSGMLTVQLFNRQAANYTQFQELNQDYYRSNRAIVYANGVFLPLVGFLASLANALLLLVGGWLFINSGNVTFGLLVAFLQYTERAFQPIRDLAERYTAFQAASASSERIFGLLDQQSQVLDPENPKAGPWTVDELKGQNKTSRLSSPTLSSDTRHLNHQSSIVNPAWAEVRFDNVTFGYNPEFPIIRDMSFTIRAGEKVAIVGATGAGKTSLISLLGRNYDVQKGAVKIGGTDIREVTQKDLRHYLALVLQDPVMFKGTIADNIRLGRPDLSEAEMEEAARYVGAHEFIMKLPGGYNYALQEHGSNISAGQRQLLSFARALAYNPNAILILDEATSSVDTESEAIIQEALKKLLENRTALIIAHRLSTIQDVDRVFVLERGRLVESGTQAELLARRGYYFQLYRNQMALAER
jgi:ATP-binding cassette subfamily B protein